MSLFGPLDSFELEDMRYVFDFSYHPDDEEIESSLYHEYGPLPDTQEGVEDLIGRIKSEKRQNDLRKLLIERRERQMAHQVEFLRKQMSEIADENLERVTDPSNHRERRKREIDNGN